jgi:hypothetical protein
MKKQISVHKIKTIFSVFASMEECVVVQIQVRFGLSTIVPLQLPT